jgi:hypothetical protein
MGMVASSFRPGFELTGDRFVEMGSFVKKKMS